MNSTNRYVVAGEFGQTDGLSLNAALNLYASESEAGRKTALWAYDKSDYTTRLLKSTTD